MYALGPSPLLSIVQLLVSFEIVEPGESLAAFRTLVRPFTAMAQLMILAMKVASKCLPTHRTGMICFLAFRCRRVERFRQIAHLRMECAGVLLKVSCISEA